MKNLGFFYFVCSAWLCSAYSMDVNYNQQKRSQFYENNNYNINNFQPKRSRLMPHITSQSLKREFPMCNEQCYATNINSKRFCQKNENPIITFPKEHNSNTEHSAPITTIIYDESIFNSPFNNTNNIRMILQNYESKLLQHMNTPLLLEDGSVEEESDKNTYAKMEEENTTYNNITEIMDEE